MLVLSDPVRVAAVPESITDMQLGGASGGTEMTAVWRGSSSSIVTSPVYM